MVAGEKGVVVCWQQQIDAAATAAAVFVAVSAEGSSMLWVVPAAGGR
jgi:hypothetical protein